MNAAQSSYQISTRNDPYVIYELIESATDSRVQICPERGGIVIGCQLNGEELLYLDRATFVDPKANIRGGIPVLFPICGQLVGGEYEWEGVTYKMRNHGVSRTEAWEVAEQSTDGQAALTVVQRSDATTLAAYPFEFELRFTYRLKDGKLTIAQSYRNLSDRPMPVQAGFHPYFATGDNKKLAYRSDATKLLDYNDNQVKPFDGTFDLNGKVESSALLDAKTPSISFPLRDAGTITLDYSEPFNKVVLWSVEGKPFICVEPWTALNEALNTREGLIMVQPGEALDLDLGISFEKK